MPNEQAEPALVCMVAEIGVEVELMCVYVNDTLYDRCVVLLQAT